MNEGVSRRGDTRSGREKMIYDSIAISIVLLFLSGVVLICALASVMPLFMNRDNVLELMPIAMKGAKISIVLAGVCVVLELVSPGSVVRNVYVAITTAALFAWPCGLVYLLKYRGRQLLS